MVVHLLEGMRFFNEGANASVYVNEKLIESFGVGGRWVCVISLWLFSVRICMDV